MKPSKAVLPMVLTLFILLVGASFCYGQEGLKGIVITDDVKVMKNPQLEAKVVGTLDSGEYVQIISSTGDWYQIRMGSNGMGFVHNQFMMVLGDQKKGVVQASVLNVRKSPELDAQIIKKLPNQAQIKIIGQTQDWYQIDLGDVQGFVASEYVQIKENDKRAIIMNNDVSLMSYASEDAEVLGKLQKNYEVFIKDFNNGWYCVVTKDQKQGWISRRDAQITMSKKPITSRGMMNRGNSTKILQIATQQLGKPYVYGSSGPNGFDCSGFTSFVYGQAGIKLNRTSSGQAYNGKKVSKSELEQGDLVFFDTSGRNNYNISHVGIYMGNGQFIHASTARSERRISISQLESDYYKGRYVTARRIL